MSRPMIEPGNWREKCKPGLWSTLAFNLRMRWATVKEVNQVETNLKALKECARPQRPISGIYHYRR